MQVQIDTMFDEMVRLMEDIKARKHKELEEARLVIIIIFIAVFYHRVLNAQITGNRDIQTSSQTTKHSYVYSRKRKD